VNETSVEVHPLRCGDALAPPGWFFRGDASNPLRALGVGVPKSRWVGCPIGAFLLVHPSRGPLLVDTGLHPDAADRLASNFGRLNARFFSTLRASRDRTVAAQLRARGIDAADIDLVVMTHLHVDHASAMSEFPRATFGCAREEWEAATARFGVWQGYVRSQLPSSAALRLLDFGGPDAQPWGPFPATIDLLGDGSVRLLFTPGHTRGHLSVLVRSTGRDVLIVGDALYTLRNLREDHLPWRTADDDLYRQSMARLREYAGAHPDAQLIPTHDTEVWDRIAA
jgi:glyoxylase-like metal-dependent hydrolase (beta-lactamase superfamily II)